MIKIEEPIQNNNMPISEKKSGISIGIDLGTTNTIVSFVENQIVTTIEDIETDIIPSCVAFHKSGKVVSGVMASHYSDDGEWIVIKSFKRKIGLDKGYKIFDKNYTPTQIASLLLMHIKGITEKKLNQEIVDCIITVPAYFNDLQRNEIKQAAKAANLDVKRIINEPTAAAIAYGLDNESEGIYIVYDFGGGTFDMSILLMEKGIFRVIASKGDLDLGGDDIDTLLAQYISKKYNIVFSSALIDVAKKIKEYLSLHAEYAQTLEINNELHTINVSIDDIENVAMDIIRETIDIAQSLITESEIEVSEVFGIILVGGMTRMPMIKRKINEIMPNVRQLTDLDPDKIVGIGAGIKAAGKNSGFENILLDISPLSLGIETLGGVVEKIIYRNTPIPCSVTQYFTTSHDNQTGIKINILQGERELAQDCRSIGLMTLSGIPTMPAGMPKLCVKFCIDVDGILSVDAQEEISGKSVALEMKPTYGMDYKIMSDMLLDSINNAKEDISSRMLIESIESAKLLIHTINKAIDEDGDMLSRKELEEIESLIVYLESILKSNDRDEISKLTKDLQALCIPFFEDRVSKYLKANMVGTSIDYHN